MIKSSVFHKMDKEYCYLLDKGVYLIKIKTAKNDLKKVILGYCDKYLNQRNVEIYGDIFYQDMTKVAQDELFDYYEVEFKFNALVTRYFFELIDFDGKTSFYTGYHFYEERPTKHENMFDASQPVREEEMFMTPSWADGAIVYQIFPERFARANLDTSGNWYKFPMHYMDKLGGSIRGIIDGLNYLKDLGIEVIYLTPIFKSSSNHKYNTNDYLEIDPDFGNEEDLKELVLKAHENNIKIILDGVFNHTGYEFAPFQDLLKNQENSKYKDWYYPFSFPIKAKRGEKPNFWTFGYTPFMPKLNTSNKEVRDYIFKVVRKWLDFGIDGWRLDVADEVSHDFWKEFRKVVKAKNKDALIIGEVWYESSPWLLGDEYDTVMNYLFNNNVKNILLKDNYKVTDFDNANNFLRGRMHKKVLPLLWNLIDSHDTARFITEANDNKTALKLALSLQMTLPGMPMIYYGDEIGLSGSFDPDCRRGMLWDEEKQDKELLNYYKKWINIHKKYKLLKNGDFKTILADDINNIYIFSRYKDEDEIYVIFNFGNKPQKVAYIESLQIIDELEYDGLIHQNSTYVFKKKN